MLTIVDGVDMIIVIPASSNNKQHLDHEVGLIVDEAAVYGLSTNKWVRGGSFFEFEIFCFQFKQNKRFFFFVISNTVNMENTM